MKHIKKIEIILTLIIGAILISFLFAANAISSPNTNLKITRLKLDKSTISPNQAVNLTYWLKPEGMISQCFNMGIDVKKGERKKRLKSWGLPSKLCNDLRQGRTISQTWQVKIPNWGSGTYVISIYADVNNYLKERNRDDNRMEKTLVVAEAASQLPDLYISEFSLSPSTPTQSRHVKVRIGVYNRGSARAGGFTVEWWAGENFPKPAKVWQVDGLAAKGGRILTYTYDGYRSWYGKLTTKAVADSKGKVKEQNEKDNVKRMEIKVRKKEGPTVVALPDLYVSEFSLSPLKPKQGQPVNVRVGVYNQGSARAGAYTVEWWASKDFSEPACTWQVNGTAARGGKIIKCTYDGYPGWYPRIKTKAVVDSRNEVKEKDESNNTRTKEIKVLRSPPATVETSAGTCSISGEVSGAEVGFRIHLYGPDDFALQRDSKFMRQPGTYSFTSLPDGRYRISISIEGDTWLSPHPPSQIVECRGGAITNKDFELR